MIIDAEDEYDEFLAHYGTPRKSGRYPWGSGEDPYQNSKNFLGYVAQLRKEGWTAVEIAEAFSTDDYKFTTTDLRNYTKIHGARVEAEERERIHHLRYEKQMSGSAIARMLDMPEATVRARLKPVEETKHASLIATRDALKARLKETGGYLDFSHGSANYLGISPEKLATAIAMLKDEGYETFWLKDPQLGTGKETTTKVLGPPGSTFPDLLERRGDIHTLATYSEDMGKTFKRVEPPASVNPARVAVRYKEQGGADKDGVIELRRGVPDLSLDQARYAQVRIKVGKDHYLKGMAMYGDDMPDGVDIIFNTNKSDKGDKLKAMKDIKKDSETGVQSELPFGSIVRQKEFIDPKTGRKKLSALNIVGTTKTDDEGNDISYAGEEGGWNTWSKTLSSQMLSKQTTPVAKRQLALALERKQLELDEIQKLTNPVIKKKLLDAFADGADSAANHLKAAGLPRTANHVILPINSLKDNEIYAPNYNDGERVVLVRHPHGGTFEIPELIVNNKNREANRLIKNAKDAVGINSNVAGILSGADFDGDTVLVIPNPNGAIRTKPPLKGLKDFNPAEVYAPYDGMKTIDGAIWDASAGKAVFPIDHKTGKPRKANKQNKQTEMGVASNLITDMSLRGATDDELARAVRHSMVVIDSEKHSLDWRTSAKANNISQLKAKYQSKEDGTSGGSATLISRAKSPIRIDARKPRPAAEGGNIDPETGEKMWVLDDRKKFVNAAGEEVYRKMEVSRMSYARDARELISDNGGTVMEHVYAAHANGLKSLANQARKASAETPPLKRTPSAAQAFAPQVQSLAAKLDMAQKNAPLERKAQRLGKIMVDAMVDANPDLDKDGLRKINAAAINEARHRVGAQKPALEITPIEWQAIQAGAITNNMLSNILNAADLDKVKALATPRESVGLAPAKASRARALLDAGHTYAEVADLLGVSTSTIRAAIDGV